MNGPALVAEHLDGRADSVISSWRDAMKSSGDVPQFESLTYAEFVDHVPQLIDQMADRLRGESADVADMAEKHGHMRWSQGYDAVEIVAEFGHLREALIQSTFAFARANDFAFDALQASVSAVDVILNEAMTESVRQFQEDSLAQEAERRAEVEAALNRQREIAEESSRHKSRLMAALSHDARTPLNAVVLSAQLLEMQIEPSDDAEVAECLRTIRNGVKNVLDLLGDLLDLTRIDAGAMPVERSRFPLEAALAECLSSIETQAKMKGLDCRLEADGLVGLTVETDRAKLKQILANFLSNALRYTERGHVRMLCDRTDAYMSISVQDTGVGIDAADQAHIFDEFATLESPNRAKDGSTGLGLAICRRLALLLGGEILVASAKGRGSTFTLTLPTTIVTQDAADERPAETLDHDQPKSPIVVAEDHPDSRKTLARLLRRMGYRVHEAADGHEALSLARAERPLAILMDINMPVMDGIDATLAIRADADLRGLAVFALTGDVSPDNQRRIGEAGVQGYLEKPVTTDALRKALGTLSLTA